MEKVKEKQKENQLQQKSGEQQGFNWISLAIVLGILIVVIVGVFVFAKPCLPCAFKLLTEVQELK